MKHAHGVMRRNFHAREKNPRMSKVKSPMPPVSLPCMLFDLSSFFAAPDGPEAGAPLLRAPEGSPKPHLNCLGATTRATQAVSSISVVL